MKDLTKFKKIVEPSENYQFVIDSVDSFLKQVCDDLINEQDGIEWSPWIEQKYLVNDGKLFVCGFCPAYVGQYKNEIFKIIVAEDGFPVTLSYQGIENVFKEKASFEKHLWDEVLKDKDIISFFKALKALNRLE